MSSLDKVRLLSSCNVSHSSLSILEAGYIVTCEREALHNYISVSHRYMNTAKRESYSCNRPRMPIGLWDLKASTFSRQLAHRWQWGCEKLCVENFSVTFRISRFLDFVHHPVFQKTWQNTRMPDDGQNQKNLRDPECYTLSLESLRIDIL
jgi:hypothetical protein